MVLLVSIGASLPTRVRNYHDLKKAHEELLSLQQAVVGKQNQIREAQAQILKAQDEIKTLQRR